MWLLSGMSMTYVVVARVEYDVWLSPDMSMTYVVARVEYDAYRTDLELLQTGPRDLSSQNKIEESKRKFSAHKEKFEKLRSDVSIKLRFLDENKVRSLATVIYCTPLSLLGDWLTSFPSLLC